MTQPRILKLAASASALVAALAMGTAGAVTASAADTVPTADLKINNAAGRTFAAVKVGDYTQVQAPPAGSQDDGTVSVATVTDPAQVKTSSVNALTGMFPGGAPDGVAVDPISYIATNWGVGKDSATTGTDAGKPQYDGKVREFLTAIWKDADFRALFESSSAITKTAAAGASTLEFNGIPQGEYILVDMTTYDADKGVTLPMFVSTTAKVTADGDPVKVTGTTDTIDSKGEVPGRPAKTTDKQDYNVGDTVTFTIKSTVPTYSGFDPATYKLMVHDTLTPGLTFDKDHPNATVKLKSTGKDDVDIPASATNGYELSTDGDTSDGGKILFNLSPYFRDRLTNNDGRYAGYTIEITYDTILNETAINKAHGDVHNSASLEYSNNPNASESGETGTTPEGKSNVYTYNFDVTTKDKSTKETLDGAEFKVTKGTTELKFVKRNDGTYRLAQPSEYALTTPVTADGGKLQFVGLESGQDYKVQETKAPKGYMTLPNLTYGMEINPEYEANADTGEKQLKDLKYGFTVDIYGLSEMTNDKTGSYLVYSLKNLSQLPLTGAAGITFLVTVGVLLVGAGTCIYMASVRSRRAENTAVRV